VTASQAGARAKADRICCLASLFTRAIASFEDL
jgi:hypothetical protein